MRYREHYPQPPLSQFVECFWTLEGVSDSTQPDRILPDGCVELILNFGERFAQHVDNHKTLQPQNFLVGQMTGPILISPTGTVQLIGIRFHPGGTAPFLRLPMHEVTNQVVALEGLAPELERQLLKVSIDLPTMLDRVATIQTKLTTYIISHKNNSSLIALTNRIVEGRGLISVDQLASDAGISTRQLERKFLNEVGIGPKLLSRILRFQQVFRAVERSDASWAPVAIDCGYYDQAHLIRDFNQFAQQTPAVFLAEQTELTQSFTRKSRKSHFYNTEF
jgi:AraC-like DNA-binding protein